MKCDVSQAGSMIPTNPNLEKSNTLLAFSERIHNIAGELIPLTAPEEDAINAHLITIHNEDSNDVSLKTVLVNNTFLILLLCLCSLSLGYLWHGRKYFFLAPFYMNIPKEKLLDHLNREKISGYLSEYNGSNLSEISYGTGINIQTLRHHMRLFEQSNLVLKKNKRFFIKKSESEIFDTEILSPVLQRVFEIIREGDKITVSKLIERTKRSKPWIGNRLHDLLLLDVIEIVKVGRFKYIYPKGQTPTNFSHSSS